jgi:hypothetical protein
MILQSHRRISATKFPRHATAHSHNASSRRRQICAAGESSAVRYEIPSCFPAWHCVISAPLRTAMPTTEVLTGSPFGVQLIGGTLLFVAAGMDLYAHNRRIRRRRRGAATHDPRRSPAAG